MVGNKPPLTFLSYSREDSAFALKLAQDMRSAGLNIWMDQLNIHAGMRWDCRVEKALEDCECLLILLSPDAVSSSNVLVMIFEEEYDMAIPDQDVINIVTVGDAHQYGLKRLS